MDARSSFVEGLKTDDEPVSDSKADTPSENAVLESIDDIELDATQLLARKLRRASKKRHFFSHDTRSFELKIEIKMHCFWRKKQKRYLR